MPIILSFETFGNNHLGCYQSANAMYSVVMCCPTGIVDDSGGAITMMNMVAQTGTPKSYDCIWLVKSSAREASESQISIRVAQFDEMGEFAFGLQSRWAHCIQ